MICVLFLGLLAGCGSRMVGDYRADVRLREGKEESTEKGYTVADMTAKLKEKPRVLSLKSDGRYVYRTGDGSNEGTWRVEGDSLILKDDTSNGTRIVPALRMERTFRIGPQGELINEKSYSHYNLQLVFRRQ